MSALSVFLMVIAILCLIIGFLGCIVPALPGVPLSFVALLLLHFSGVATFSWQFLLILGLIVVLIQVLDFLIPMWGTKYFGGGRLGSIGCIVGTFIGMFFLPFGIFIGPFVGAVIGEILDGKNTNEALRAGLGSFIGFVTGLFLKLIISVGAIIIFVYKCL